MADRKWLERLVPIGAMVALLAIAAPDAGADIYKWTDDQGTLHFTDDPTTIPPSKRDQMSPFIKEPPPSAAQDAPAPPPSAPAYSGQPERETFSPPPARGASDLEQEIEQLRAKISAKESLIRAVDEKRSLATNPLRNRIVSPADMELYRKYQLELPSDRERLANLEAQLAR